MDIAATTPARRCRFETAGEIGDRTEQAFAQDDAPARPATAPDDIRRYSSPFEARTGNFQPAIRGCGQKPSRTVGQQSNLPLRLSAPISGRLASERRPGRIRLRTLPTGNWSTLEGMKWPSRVWPEFQRRSAGESSAVPIRQFVLDLKQGNCLRTLAGHEAINAVVFAPQGRIVASGKRGQAHQVVGLVQWGP